MTISINSALQCVATISGVSSVLNSPLKHTALKAAGLFSLCMLSVSTMNYYATLHSIEPEQNKSPVLDMINPSTEEGKKTPIWARVVLATIWAAEAFNNWAEGDGTIKICSLCALTALPWALASTGLGYAAGLNGLKFTPIELAPGAIGFVLGDIFLSDKMQAMAQKARKGSSSDQV